MKRKEHSHTIRYESCIISHDEIERLIGLDEDEKIKSIKVNDGWSIEIKTEKIDVKFINK